MWFAQRFSPSNSIFNIAEMVEIHGPIDKTLFETAIQQTAMEAEATVELLSLAKKALEFPHASIARRRAILTKHAERICKGT